MPDLDSSLDLHGVRVVQQPLLDDDDMLVPPWDAPMVFRKGTLVSVEAHLTVFHFMDETPASHVSALLILHLLQLLMSVSALPAHGYWGAGSGAISVGVSATAASSPSPKEGSPAPQCHVQQGIQQGQWRSCESRRHERRGHGQRSHERRCEYELST